MSSTVSELLTKQFIHYVEVYGLGLPGLFDLEVDNGKKVSIRLIHGATAQEIQDTVNAVIYRNAPIKNVEAIKTILCEYSDYNFALVRNNDLRVDLYNPESKFCFSDGDDAVRWIVKNASQSDLLIKSKEVLAEIRSNSTCIPHIFLVKHEHQLATVFNRHKAILLSLKTRKNATLINRIARKSKTFHVPLQQAFGKSFLSRALKDKNFDFSSLDTVSIRDKLKVLNLIAWKLSGYDIDAFIIRNGKIHIKEGRRVDDTERLLVIQEEILKYLNLDFYFIKGKKILLDPKVDYGLPVSAKQTMGRLPFGTRVKIEGEAISSGIHWHDDWGARDLDLSCIDKKGDRIGWGSYLAYDNKSDIKFSGDVTSAYNGAMEFMTSKKSSYGLFVNIFSGKVPSEADIVVGNQSGKRNWIDDIVIQERISLKSKGSIVGFVHGKTFVVYSGRLNNRMVSGANPVVARGFASFWTIRDLFDKLEIDYDVTKKELDYDFDLSYNTFTFDKLEKLISAPE